MWKRVPAVGSSSELEMCDAVCGVDLSYCLFVDKDDLLRRVDATRCAPTETWKITAAAGDL